METWNEMTARHAKEEAVLANQNQVDWYNFRLQGIEDAKAETELMQRMEQAKKDMIARHFAEAKAHHESPDLDAKWDDYFRPKNVMSMEEYMEQQKTEEQKLEEELRSAVARDGKTEFERMQEEAEKKQRERSQGGIEY